MADFGISATLWHWLLSVVQTSFQAMIIGSMISTDFYLHSTGANFAQSCAFCVQVIYTLRPQSWLAATQTRAPLISSGGASGSNDFAVINKRAGGAGLISDRKSFQCPMGEGVKLLNLIQDVYLNQDITIA